MPRGNLCAVGLLQAALLILLLRLLYKKREAAGETLPAVQHSFGRLWRTTGQILGTLSAKPTSWPGCTSPLKALSYTVIMERGITGITTTRQHHLPFQMPHQWSKRGKSRHKSMASYCQCFFLKLLHPLL